MNSSNSSKDSAHSSDIRAMPVRMTRNHYPVAGKWLSGWQVWAGERYLGAVSHRNDGRCTCVASPRIGYGVVMVGSIGIGLELLRYVNG